jgi:hypothetical protein
MRFSTVALGLLAIVTPLAAAWSKEDHEIFRVQDEVALHEEPGVTFYGILDVTPSATGDEITKAHRTKTRSLHPDKVRQQLTKARTKAQKEAGKSKKIPPPTSAEITAAIKDATERQARLTLIVNILRDQISRERYDHFLKNGFPVWKGTGYYYNRYRPGLGTVVISLFVFAGGGIHYLALYMSWRRQREFIGRYIKFARETAWGSDVVIPGIEEAPPAPEPTPAEESDEGPPMPVNRKQRRMQERESKRDSGKESGRKSKKAAASASSGAVRSEQPRPTGPTGAKRRVVAENGKILVVDSLRDVYLEAEDEEGNTTEFLLDPDELPCPTIHDTLLVRAPKWLYTSTVGRVTGPKVAQDSAVESEPELEPQPQPVTRKSTRKVTPKPAEVSAADDESDAAQHTPPSDSADEFEFLDKPGDSMYKAKTSSSQPSGGKAGKRKGKKK